MRDRLTEIEGRVNRTAIGGVHVVDNTYRPWDDDAAWLQAKEYIRADVTWLIAHVRELEGAFEKYAKARAELRIANTSLRRWHRVKNPEGRPDPVVRVANAQAAFAEAEQGLFDAYNSPTRWPQEDT